MIRFSLPVSTLVFALILTACGGGRETNQAIGPRIDPSLPAPARISQARPIPGSVSQSSNTNNGVTTDRIEVIPNVVPRPWPWSWQEDGSYSIVKNNKSLGRVTKEDNFLETPTTALKADLIQYSDGDYFIYGVWSERKDGGSLSIDNLFEGDVGVFVDGSNEYEGSIYSLTGTATYSDNVEFTKYNTNSNYYRDMCGVSCVGFSLHGANTELEARRLIDLHKQYNDGFAIGDTLTGSMNLKVDFDNNNSLGHIEGTIDNFTDEKIVSVRYNGAGVNPDYALTFQTVDLPGSLRLERSTLGESHSGFFDGNLSGNINGRNYSGKWGGQFYDYYGTNFDHPTHIAGTLAASSGDFNIIAPWFVTHDGQTPTALPIYFRQPQEDNPQIGLAQSEDNTVTTDPSDDRVPTAVQTQPQAGQPQPGSYEVYKYVETGWGFNPLESTSDNIVVSTKLNSSSHGIREPYNPEGTWPSKSFPYENYPPAPPIHKSGKLNMFSYGLWSKSVQNREYNYALNRGLIAQFYGDEYEKKFSGSLNHLTCPSCGVVGPIVYEDDNGFSGIYTYRGETGSIVSDVKIKIYITNSHHSPLSMSGEIGNKKPIIINNYNFGKITLGASGGGSRNDISIFDDLKGGVSLNSDFLYTDGNSGYLTNKARVDAIFSNDGVHGPLENGGSFPSLISGRLVLNGFDEDDMGNPQGRNLDNSILGVFIAEKTCQNIIGKKDDC